MGDKKLFQHDQESLFDICSDFTLARSYSGVQTQRPDFIKVGGGSILSFSPKNAKHSIQINLSKGIQNTTELDFRLSFLADNITILASYVIIFFFVWALLFIPLVGAFFFFALIITAIIHIPWWVYSRGKIRKEFWLFVDSKTQALPSNRQNSFGGNMPKEPRFFSTDETNVYTPNTQSTPTSKTTQCSKCKKMVKEGTRFCPNCGNFIS